MCDLINEAKEATHKVDEIVERMGKIAGGNPTRSFLDHYVTVRTALSGTSVALVIAVLVMYVTR